MYQLFEPARLGPMELRNRIIRSATNEHLSMPDGQLSTTWVETLRELAEGGVGLVITGHLTVDRKQRADEGQPVLDGKTDRALLAQCAREIHRADGRIVVQLSHSGLKAPEKVNGVAPVGPADFTAQGLQSLREQFCRAAQMCQTAGFDGVQVHCAHGYLLSSFLSPKLNTRSDAYGGTLEHRFLLIREILEAIRGECGDDFALLVKIDQDVCGDLHGLLDLLEGVGVDGVEVSGLDFYNRPGEKGPFYLRQVVEAKRGIGLPISLVGGVFCREDAQCVLDAGIPFVSLSRSLICQPDFVKKMEQGEESKCLACNQCFTVYRQRPVRCVLHEEEIPLLDTLFSAGYVKE